MPGSKLLRPHFVKSQPMTPFFSSCATFRDSKQGPGQAGSLRYFSRQ